jgi:ORF6N domain
MFRLTAAEYEALRSQFATSKKVRGGCRYLPFVFTEHGAIMCASVLNSDRAVEMSLFVALLSAFGKCSAVIASS